MGGRLINGSESVEELSDDELEVVEVTIAAAAPWRRGPRLDALLLERARRRKQPELA